MASAPFVWMLQRASGVWVPFRAEDSLTLESARLAGSAAAEIEVDCGRRAVDLKSRSLRSVYWQSEPCAVRRCVWFWEKRANELAPYAEEDSEALERLSLSGTKNKPLALSDGHEVTVHEPEPDPEKPSKQKDPKALAGPWQRRADGRGSMRRAVRGLPNTPCLPTESDDAEPVRHLCLVVHGIGESLFNKDKLYAAENGVAAGVGGSYNDGVTHHIGSCDQLRSRADALTRAARASEHAAGSGGGESGGRVEFLPVLWASSVRPPNMMANLSRVTLGSVKKLRDLANARVLLVAFAD